MRSILLFILTLTLTNIYASERRLFQFVGDNKRESYIAFEGGSFSGISLISKRMQMSGGYSLLGIKGISISTDLLLFKYSFTDISILTGVGGGLIFKPNIEGLSSNFFLRLPIKIIYKNLFVRSNIMIGTPMFNYYISWNMNLSISLGYQFDIYTEKIEDSEEETDSKE